MEQGKGQVASLRARGQGNTCLTAQADYFLDLTSINLPINSDMLPISCSPLS